MHVSTPTSMSAQRGLSLTGLIFVLAVLGFIGVFGLRVVPTWMEYRACKNAIAIAKSTGGSLREMQETFDKNADINNIEAITGKDLIVTRDTGTTELSFAYEKRIPIMTDVSLVIDYSGTTSPTGIVPEKPEPR